MIYGVAAIRTLMLDGWVWTTIGPAVGVLLVFSLSLGLLAALPVNVLLVKFGVKEGMMNPKMMA